MVALYRTGNQAEALATYQDARRVLAEELGVDASRSLQQLEAAILQQDPSLDPADLSAVVRPIEGAGRRAPALHLVEAARTPAHSWASQRSESTTRPSSSVANASCPRWPRTRRARLSGVVGPSGSGKSSAVRAGLVPAMESAALGETNWARAILRPGAEPLRELDRAVYAALDESQRALLPAGRDSIVAGAAALPNGMRLLVVVDQFEEVFTSVPDAAERTAFIEFDLSAPPALEPRRSCSRCAPTSTAAVRRNRPSPSSWRRARCMVGPMSRDEYRSVIEGPAARAGLAVEPALVERLIDLVEDRPGALPLLSTALVELWERATGGRSPYRHLLRPEEFSGAVGRLAENAYSQLTDTEQATARSVFLRLVGGEGEVMARRRVPLAEFDLATNADVQRTLTVLTAARLLTADRDTIEVAHEALFREWPRLEAWLEEDQQSLRMRVHLTEAAREWDERGRSAAELYRGARLAAVIDWMGDHAAEVNDLERQFIADSRAVSEAKSAGSGGRTAACGCCWRARSCCSLLPWAPPGSQSFRVRRPIGQPPRHWRSDPSPSRRPSPSTPRGSEPRRSPPRT